MKISILAIAAAAFACVGQAQSHEFDFSYTSTSAMAFTATLQLTASDTPAGGPFAVTGVTGEITYLGLSAADGVVTGLGNYAFADNLVYLHNPFLDTDGLSVDIAGGEFFTFYPDFTPGQAPYGEISPSISTYGDATLTAVPEPATAAILGAGLFGAAILRRRRNRN